jgi:chromosome segregation ATPase
MTGKKAVIQLLLLCGAMGLSSCAGKPPAATVSQVSQAELAVQQASKSKAPEYASVELYTAREQLASAQEALRQKEYTQARRWAERALVNAQLAETKAESEQTRRTAAELRQSIEALRREAEKPASPSQ